MRSGAEPMAVVLRTYLAPTGEYKAGELANTGLNYWAFNPWVGVSYNNPKTGFNPFARMDEGVSPENSFRVLFVSS